MINAPFVVRLAWLGLKRILQPVIATKVRLLGSSHLTVFEKLGFRFSHPLATASLSWQAEVQRCLAQGPLPHPFVPLADQAFLGRTVLDRAVPDSITDSAVVTPLTSSAATPSKELHSFTSATPGSKALDSKSPESKLSTPSSAVSASAVTAPPATASTAAVDCSAAKETAEASAACKCTAVRGSESRASEQTASERSERDASERSGHSVSECSGERPERSERSERTVHIKRLQVREAVAALASSRSAVAALTGRSATRQPASAKPQPTHRSRGSTVTLTCSQSKSCDAESSEPPVFPTLEVTRVQGAGEPPMPFQPNSRLPLEIETELFVGKV